MALCEFEKVIKDAENPMFKKADRRSNYATLVPIHDAIKPELLRHGLYYSSFERVELEGYLCVRITHAESETYIETYVKLLNMSDMQKYVSSKTYARKSGLSELCGLYAEDDDGNIASTPTKMNDAHESVRESFKPDLTADQIKSLKENLIGLWEMKEKAAINKDADKGNRVKQYIADNFMKLNEDGELIALPTVDLIKIQNYLKGL